LKLSAPVIAVAVAALLLAPGCGVDEQRQGPPFHPGNIDSPSSLLISEDDINGIGASTPYGAILRWWRALQRGDVEQLRRSYAGAVSSSKARHQIRDFQPRFSQPVVPTEDEGHKRATVEVLLRAAVRLGDTPKVIGVHDVPATFDLVRSGPGWKLSKDAYATYQRAILGELAQEL
jgi:hypothetical protein